MYSIKTKPDAVPYAISVPRRIPVPLMEAVKMELDDVF